MPCPTTGPDRWEPTSRSSTRTAPPTAPRPARLARTRRASGSNGPKPTAGPSPGSSSSRAKGLIVLNDRRVPGSKASIKLIAISPAGVFVIDAKGYKGLVHTKRQGPIRNLGPTELHVGRKNCTSSVEGLARHVEVVRGAMSSAPWGSEVPIHAILCLTRAEWGFASPIEISDVWVGWPRLVAGRLQAPEVMDSPDRPGGVGDDRRPPALSRS